MEVEDDLTLLNQFQDLFPKGPHVQRQLMRYTVDNQQNENTLVHMGPNMKVVLLVSTQY